jgi:ureidoacrylate peracid hydrolase
MSQPFQMPPAVTERVIRRLGRAHIHEAFAPQRTALVVVDMQNYFMAPGQPACTDSAREIVPTVNRLARALRSAGGTVVWIQTEALPRDAGDWATVYAIYSPEAQEARYRRLAREGDGFSLWPSLDVQPGDERVIKLRYSAFLPGASDIEERLRARGVDTVLIAGVATNVCCESTARDSMMRGFHTVMVPDALAATTDQEHAASLIAFYLYFGDVLSSDEIIARLAKSPAFARDAGVAAAAE